MKKFPIFGKNSIFDASTATGGGGSFLVDFRFYVKKGFLDRRFELNGFFVRGDFGSERFSKSTFESDSNLP